MASKNLFFSYYYRDSASYDSIITMLDNRGYFGYKNSSLNEESSSENEDYIKSKIRPQIDWAGTVVILIGPGTYTRKYVNYEIWYGAKNNKRIVGVYLRGQSSSRIPAELRRLHNEGYSELALVRWNTESIVSAIRGTNSWDEGD